MLWVQHFYPQKTKNQPCEGLLTEMLFELGEKL